MPETTPLLPPEPEEVVKPGQLSKKEIEGLLGRPDPNKTPEELEEDKQDAERILMLIFCAVTVFITVVFLGTTMWITRHIGKPSHLPSDHNEL
mmetsp:Transcript_135426/g.239550  ORF Transcript_135426/g.239550 Transcript_135426/m.239550 type:complete len:93 (-) Transcript_135426:55-333(-)